MSRLATLRRSLLAGLLAAAVGCSGGLRQYDLHGASMGTSWRVTVLTEPGTAEPLQAAQVQAILDRIEQRMSNWRADSEISRFNRHPAGCMAVSVPTREVVRASLDLSERSGGYFDPTLSALIDLWGFGVDAAPPAPPAEPLLQRLRAQSGYRNIALRGERLCKAQGPVALNLSAIAKGYAVDRVAAALRQLGYRRFLVEVGGELYGQGRNGRGEPWQIGIEQPQARLGRNLLATVRLDGRGVATSGDYRNYYELDGKRYSHLIDPLSGRPVRHQAAAVTVLHASTMLADGWATALLVAGPEKGRELAQRENLAALMAVRDGDGFAVWKSPAWPPAEPAPTN
ncbi:MAG: FAD:protein FMN transferase [Cellvibrionales bacterium]|nr:FAD:protein FMN transferase [Cellvibrionales bacterium]